MKKTLAALMSLVLMMTTLFALGVNVASAATSGDCTTTIKWSYNAASKTLTLTGTGAMPDYRATDALTNKRSPWETEKIGNDTIKSLMTKLVVGEGITNIGEYNFFNCTALTSVSLPSTLVSIDGRGAGMDLASASYGAFQNCTSLEEIALPDRLETIEPYAFKNCTALKSISFPNTLTSLGRCAFLNCTALETVTFGTGLSVTGDYAFAESGVKRINWGSITEVSNQSFYKCNMKDIEFPDQIKSVGTRAFANNTSLMSVKVNNASMEFKGTNNTTSNNFSGSNQTVTIIGHSQSTAQTFANNYGYTFVSMDDCDHLDTRTEIIEEATCTEAGLQKEICNDCEFVVSETEIPALGHDFVLDQENDSTELDGHIYRSYKCSRCDETNETVEHAMENSVYHVWVEGYYELSYLTEPSCTRPGVAVYTCTVEGCTNALGRPTSDRKVVNSGHKIAEWNETPATCTEAGQREGVCSECGETITESIPAIGHSYEDTDLISTEESEEDGHTYYYFRCKNCGGIVEEKEHTEWIEGLYTRNMLTRATCTIPGLARDTCNICGETRTQVVQATGEHEYEEESRTEPGCTTRGSVTYRCKNCDQTRTEYLPAKGHDYILDEEKTVAPSCTESGKNVYYCSVCSASKTDTVPATGHTPADGTYVIVTNPDCTKTGLAVAQCSVCGEAYEDTVEALGHDYQDVETDLTEDGKPGHVLAIPTCTRCGATEKGKVVHKEWIEGYYTTSGNSVALCETTYTTDRCSISGCNETRIHQTDGLGHEYFYVSQSYEGVTLTCSHCLTNTIVSPETLLEYWEEIKPINSAPNRTATDNSGYLDLDRNGVINAKDYSRILYLCKNEKKLIEEREESFSEQYGRERVSDGEITADAEEDISVKIEDGELHEFTFTPTESGTYTFYSSGLLDTMAFIEIGDDAVSWEKYDDNSGNLYNFKIEYECEEGVTYHILTGLVNSEATGNYKIFVTKGETDSGEENDEEKPEENPEINE
ncbi:MAG: leucine-rich repeat domain-containing protein [Eubacterium sp.]|nr:leucine-rich repeat domain-containing protein [Eubacterium sp.]